MSPATLLVLQAPAPEPMVGWAIAGAVLGLLVLLLVVPFAFWVWMLMDCFMSRSLRDVEKVLWTMLMLFFPVIGSAIYFFGGRPEREFPLEPAT